MAIVIDAKLRLGNSVTGIGKLQNALDKINQSVATLNANLLGVGANANYAAQQLAKMKGPSQRAARSASGASPARSGGRAARPPRFDPFALNPQAGMSYFARGAAMGNPYAARMFGLYKGRFSSLQRNQSGAQMFLNGGGTPIAAMLSSIVGRTRFAQIGGKMVGMPLGIDIMSLLSKGGGGALSTLLGGGGGAAGAGAVGGVTGAGAGAMASVAGPLALVAAAVGAVTMACKAAADALGQWTQSLVAGGGSMRQALGASLLGNALGTNLAGTGQNLSPYAAAQMGLSPVTGPWGDMNYNARGMRAADWVRNSRSFEGARRRASLAGDPNLANAWYLSNDNYNMLRNPSTKGIQSGDAAVVPNLMASSAVFFQNIQRFLIAFSSPILKQVSDSLTDFAKVMGDMGTEGVRRLGEGIAWAIHGLTTTLGIILRIGSWLNGIVEWIVDIPRRIKEALGFGDDHKRSVDRNTDAVNANTQAQKEGVFGGGQRAAGATPSRYHPSMGGSPAPYGVMP